LSSSSLFSRNALEEEGRRGAEAAAGGGAFELPRAAGSANGGTRSVAGRVGIGRVAAAAASVAAGDVGRRIGGSRGVRVANVELARGFVAGPRSTPISLCDTRSKGVVAQAMALAVNCRTLSVKGFSEALRVGQLNPFIGSSDSASTKEVRFAVALGDLARDRTADELRRRALEGVPKLASDVARALRRVPSAAVFDVTRVLGGPADRVGIRKQRRTTRRRSGANVVNVAEAASGEAHGTCRGVLRFARSVSVAFGGCEAVRGIC